MSIIRHRLPRSACPVGARALGPADTATSGLFERGDPAATSSGVATQLGTAASGTSRKPKCVEFSLAFMAVPERAGP